MACSSYAITNLFVISASLCAEMPPFGKEPFCWHLSRAFTDFASCLRFLILAAMLWATQSDRFLLLIKTPDQKRENTHPPLPAETVVNRLGRAFQQIGNRSSFVRNTIESSYFRQCRGARRKDVAELSPSALSLIRSRNPLGRPHPPFSDARAKRSHGATWQRA